MKRKKYYLEKMRHGQITDEEVAKKFNTSVSNVRSAFIKYSKNKKPFRQKRCRFISIIENDKLSTVFYVFVVLLIVLFYILGERYFSSASKFTDMITNIIAIIVGGTFWIEYRRNKLESQQNNKTMEAQFIMELNNQFIDNKDLMDVEFELEKYYYKYKHKELTEEHEAEFLKHFAIDNRERQKLVSYLVHLEGIAALVNNKVIRCNNLKSLQLHIYCDCV